MRRMKTPRRMVRWIILFLLAVLGISLFFLLDVADALQFDDQLIREITNENIGLILIVMLIVMIIQNVLTVFPLILVISVNIALFGFVGGYLWSWATALIGAVVSFLAARFWLHGYMAPKLNQKWVERIENHGFLYIFIARLFPFAPSNVINFAAGSSGVSLKTFIISTMAGNFIFHFLVSLFIMGLMSENMEIMVSFGIIGVILLGVFIWKKVRKKRSKA